MATNDASNDDHSSDDLFDYDADIPDIDATIRTPAEEPTSKKNALGLDEEVKIRKKRIVVKLDEPRLLSDVGIPKLRREAHKLKFKGKGHEYRDAARLLSYYQLWADDLFKKAKFRDTLKIIEKLGHSKNMRQQRQEWIDEYKYKDHATGDVKDAPEEGTTQKQAENPDDDDLYSLPPPPPGQEKRDGAPPEAHASSSGALFLPGGLDDDSDGEFGAPDDAELDSLMESAKPPPISTTTTLVPSVAMESGGSKEKTVVVPPPRDAFEDEMEAMGELDDW